MTTARRKHTAVAPGLETARPDAGDHSPGESHLPPPSIGEPHRAPSPQNNLSLPRSPLIGRDHEIAVIQRLLLQEQVGLLTLTGPGGIGKTRLALQVAANLLDHFVDGVYFVSLAPIRDPDLVGAAIAQTLGVREAAGHSLAETLQAYLKDRQLLLVLDNFEQVVAAAALVGDLLNTCRHLKTLVTSRTPLHLYGEQEFPVPPLALPDLTQLAQSTATTTVTQYAAIELFCQRASAAKPDFALTASNVSDVAKICLRLDGLPLAIELAAARIKLFSPSALLTHLQQRLPLLTGGPHDQPARQRTLRDDIAWSYDLLTPAEQTLFRRLAVFVGGFSLAAAQAVGNPSTSSGQVLGIDVLEGIATLVDQNLLKQMEQPDGEARFGMLETIREYGVDRLKTSGEVDAIRQQHTNFFLTFAETIAATWRGAHQRQAMARMTTEYANLCDALACGLRKAVGTEIPLRLAVAMGPYWLVSGNLSEGRRWLEGALACASTKRTESRSQGLIVLVALLGLLQADLALIEAHVIEGLAIAREHGAPSLTVDALICFAQLANAQQKHGLASTLLNEAVAIARSVDDKYRIGVTLARSGSTACAQLDFSRAELLFEEGLLFLQQVGAEWDIAYAYVALAKMAQHQRDHIRARGIYQESLQRWRRLGLLQWIGIVDCLEGLAGLCLVQQQFEDAARLFGMGEVLGQRLLPSFRSSAGAQIAALRPQLGEATFAAAWSEGRSFSTDQAIDYALALPEIATPVATPTPPIAPAGLTAREVEVLRLLAQGLTYAQIAEKLIVTRRTVNGHVTSIYSKLGVNGRAAATRFAVAHGLV